MWPKLQRSDLSLICIICSLLLHFLSLVWCETQESNHSLMTGHDRPYEYPDNKNGQLNKQTEHRYNRNLQLSNKLPASNYVNKQGHTKRQQENELNKWNVVKQVWSFWLLWLLGWKFYCGFGIYQRFPWESWPVVSVLVLAVWQTSCGITQETFLSNNRWKYKRHHMDVMHACGVTLIQRSASNIHMNLESLS